MLPKNIQPGTLGQKAGIMKKSWWKLIITDYPNFDPNDADLEHIAELIKQGYHQGQLIQEEEKNKKSCKLQAPSSIDNGPGIL